MFTYLESVVKHVKEAIYYLHHPGHVITTGIVDFQRYLLFKPVLGPRARQVDNPS